MYHQRKKSGSPSLSLNSGPEMFDSLGFWGFFFFFSNWITETKYVKMWVWFNSMSNQVYLIPIRMRINFLIVVSVQVHINFIWPWKKSSQCVSKLNKILFKSGLAKKISGPVNILSYKLEPSLTRLNNRPASFSSYKRSWKNCLAQFFSKRFSWKLWLK